MSYSYRKIGYGCLETDSNAIISNHKYILPYSKIYKQEFTPMFKYPFSYKIGIKHFPTLKDTDPESIKSYNSNIRIKGSSTGGCVGCKKN